MKNKKRKESLINCFYLLKHDPYFKYLSIRDKKFHQLIYDLSKNKINQNIISLFVEKIYLARANYCLIQEIKRVAQGKQYYNDGFLIYTI